MRLKNLTGQPLAFNAAVESFGGLQGRLADAVHELDDLRAIRDALTPSERRVAALAVEGLSNREIAESLWVTRKTVELHLGNAYAKLGIRSRRQLPPELAASAADPA